MNTIIEKIRAEIERRREEIRPTDTGKMKVVGTPTQLEQGWLNALFWMEKVLDTLQEPIDEWSNKERKARVKKTGEIVCGFTDGQGHFDIPTDHNEFIRYNLDELEFDTLQEQPVDWQKVAEAHAKDQPLGQDNDGNLVYLQEQPVDTSEDERINTAIFKALSKKDARDVLKECGVDVGDALDYLKRQSKPEVCDGLEEYAQKVEDYYDVGEERGYLCVHRGDIKNAVITGTKWQKEQMMKDGLDAVKSGQFNKIEKTIAGVFVKYGMDKQKEIMLGQAVEGYVTLTMTGTLTVAATIKEGDNIGLGDKVRIIIVKED